MATYSISDHHPATLSVVQYFQYGHLPEGPLRDASARFYDLAFETLLRTPPGPEVTVGLRKLLEAKDCIVRACLPPRPPADVPTGR